MRKAIEVNKSLFIKLSCLLTLLFISACTQTLTTKNPYTGFYVSDNDPEYKFIIVEREGKLYERNGWGKAELTVKNDNSYLIESWQVTGDFLDEEEGEFQRIVLQVEGGEYTFNRVKQQASIDFLYGNSRVYTNFSNANPQSCEVQYPLHSLSQNSIHPEKIEKLIKQIKSDRYGWGAQDSLLIYQNDKLLVEEYFNGWKRDDAHHTNSVSKSITSLLVGSLITEGKLQGVDEALAGYLPQYQHLLSGEKLNITLSNFLNMSAGLEWDEWSVPYSDPTNIRQLAMNSDDVVAFTLKRDLSNIPGQHFSYSGGYVSVVGEVIATAAHQATAADYAQSGPLEALCFKNSFWRKENVNKSNVDAGVMMRPIDMLKVGQLMLNDGQWQGKQIINQKWIKDSMDPAINPYKYNYGYFWWRANLSAARTGKQYSVVMARGSGGQNIAIIKELNLVVVTTASNHFNDMGAMKIDQMLKRFIFPTFIE